LSSRKQRRSTGPGRPAPFSGQYWIIQTLNSLALGGLLSMLAAGFSLIFGLMRIANLTHGALFMLGAYIGATVIVPGLSLRVPIPRVNLVVSLPFPDGLRNLWIAAVVGGLVLALLGGLFERLILRKLVGY